MSQYRYTFVYIYYMGVPLDLTEVSHTIWLPLLDDRTEDKRIDHSENANANSNLRMNAFNFAHAA